MKNLRYAIALAALLLAPAFVLAEESTEVRTNAAVKAEAKAEAKPGKVLPPSDKLFPSVGPAIREAASSTRAGVAGVKDALRTLAGTTTKADVRVLIESGKVPTTTIGKIELRARVEAKKKEAVERAVAAREKAKEKFSEAVHKSVGAIVNRLSDAAQNLVSLADRLESRISAAEGQGRDMADSLVLLTAARLDVTVAQEKVTRASDALIAALGSDTPKEVLPAVREAVKAAEESIKAAKESLRAALESLKAEVRVGAEAGVN